MLTHQQLATIRAALRFWEEEMCPHDEQVMGPYFDSAVDQSLTADELKQLREAIAAGARYALYDPAQNRLGSIELFTEYKEAERASGGLNVATVIMSRPSSKAV